MRSFLLGFCVMLSPCTPVYAQDGILDRVAAIEKKAADLADWKASVEARVAALEKKGLPSVAQQPSLYSASYPSTSPTGEATTSTVTCGPGGCTVTRSAASSVTRTRTRLRLFGRRSAGGGCGG